MKTVTITGNEKKIDTLLKMYKGYIRRHDLQVKENKSQKKETKKKNIVKTETNKVSPKITK